MVHALHLKKIRKGLAKYATLFFVASLSLSVSAVEYAANFKGTDINEFINIVGKNLNKTVIIDPNVRGKVNVRSYELMDEALYYQFFLNVLEVYGYSAVEMDNGILKIEKSSDAKKSNVPLVTEDDQARGDMMITRVVRVKNVSVQELGPLVRQFSDQKDGGHVANFNAANVMMLTGHAASVNRLVEIIRSVDQAGDKRVDIVKLNFATADDVVSVVDNIYKDSGKGSIPEFLIPKVVADGRTNSVIVSGEGQARTRAIELIKRLDGELQSQGNTKVIYLNYASAEDLVKVLQGVSKTLGEEGQGGATKTRSRNQNETSIEAHPDSNSLVITAQPDTMRSLESVIERLDIRRAQVLVEAIIVEVMEADGINFGLQWISEQGGMMQFNNGTTVPVGSLAVAAEQARDKTVTKTLTGDNTELKEYDETQKGDLGPLGALLGGINGLAMGIVKNDWGAIIQAVSTDTNSNILATPSVTTMDNEEASMIVGQEVPIITGSQTGSNNSNPFQTVERQEVGVKLKVTPQINDGSAVQLTIEQEVSGVSGTTSVDISINKRAIKTTVMADDGGMVVLGGLIDEDVQESVSKVPILGDIPILGHLFRSTSTSKRKRNLIVFIRPTIIRDGIKMNKLSHSKYNFIRGEQYKQKEDGIDLMPLTDAPILPEWNDALVLPPTYEEYLRQQNTDERNND
ncbi:type II secretion system secretin GspD [Pseudoalteromonas sp. SG43-7]|jgi:general secretion pathway protein D|uniref:Type II secretion system protein GspD n=1 Tax=Pseudoalteromonas neustonica TaxID=1840331 RepID=A0ABY3F754_9GAMM|nr:MULTISPECIES: type II secretion system secretin GspD [Pseudoalteromonas]MBB1295419.1 type II secretion system secretin GspD [Pseudoalteromonas sp. SR41-4]MBB1399881.1 type II secretion system secretin GspD [Pseudoalteromonas sp. SG44-8]MBB1411488.1 type II secretion system secretin GspD [Pseudoalteromonas sp. SG44-17]MBB1424110.1 type II secretion system secretin GspD [Pseudoalteromonas sp. SG43-7]MBB1507659.1 type II secretion system secretin GspD [Pseudoalteromonas sp. SG41-1]|tara:strand:+ start:8257 stop:10317 length:2061 start_codon:yes stop_codon:yes gene_type:complete